MLYSITENQHKTATHAIKTYDAMHPDDGACPRVERIPLAANAYSRADRVFAGRVSVAISPSVARIDDYEFEGCSSRPQVARNTIARPGRNAHHCP
jgi:hypothetical protein